MDDLLTDALLDDYSTEDPLKAKNPCPDPPVAVDPKDYQRVTLGKVQMGDLYVNAMGQWFRIIGVDHRGVGSLDVLALTTRQPGPGSGRCMKKGEARHIVNPSQWLSRVLRYVGEL